jgi:TetR/AcrR family transcriptional repressor of lmrAB and yxaGH operons
LIKINILGHIPFYEPVRTPGRHADYADHHSLWREGDAVPRPRSDSRDKIVEGARTLLRRQGYAGTGLAQIIEFSGAPRGSVYFLFPGGKEEIAVAAVNMSAERVPELVRQAREDSPTVARWLEAIAGHFADQLRASDFAEGCPITTVALDSVPQSKALTAACRRAYGNWLTAITDGLVSYGISRTVAPGLATTMLAAVEGALVLCRVWRNTDPLRQVTEQMLTLVEHHG